MSTNYKNNPTNPTTSTSSTPYDDVFRTLLDACPRLILPVINELFGCHYRGNEHVELSQNEHFLLGEQETISDSSFSIAGSPPRYHLECQSISDGSMMLRMLRYDLQIALANAEQSDEILRISLPESAVLYLRSTSRSPDSLVMEITTSEDVVRHNVNVMKMKQYTIEEIFAKKLWFLIPFYLFNYERRFSDIEGSPSKMKNLISMYEDTIHQLDKLVHEGALTEYEKRAIMEMTTRVSDALARRHEPIRKGVSHTMGGNILDFEAKTIFNSGRSEGFESGRSERSTEIARAMKAEGDSADRIARITGMSVVEIEAL